MIYYKIIPSKKLVVEYFKGDIYWDDMFSFIDEISKDKNYNVSFNSLIDLREATLQLTTDDVKKYIRYLEEHTEVLGKRKLAMITNSPNQVVYVTLYQLLSDKLPLKIKIFSTYQKALYWLDMPEFTENEFNSLISEFLN